MASVVSAQFTASLQGAITNALAVTGMSGNGNLPYVISLALAAGTAAGQVNQAWPTAGTVTAGGSVDLDLYAPGVTDPVGNALTFARVKLVIIVNLNTLETDTLQIGNKAATSGWTSLVSPNTGYIPISGAGGFLILAAPGATGLAVTSSSLNHLLHLAAPGANNVNYVVITFGCNV